MHVPIYGTISLLQSFYSSGDNVHVWHEEQVSRHRKLYVRDKKPMNEYFKRKLRALVLLKDDQLLWV